MFAVDTKTKAVKMFSQIFEKYVKLRKYLFQGLTAKLIREKILKIKPRITVPLNLEKCPPPLPPVPVL
jgi:hypothetical protein